MITAIDHLLDRITMYRLVLYYLIALLVVAVGLCLTGHLSFDPVALVFSAVYLTAVCWITNTVFARVFQAPTNIESVYITALILALILNPVTISHDVIFLGFAGMLAMASKYMLVWHRQHIINPAAIAAVLVAFGLGQAASWWVGTAAMLPAVIIGGLLVARKIQRFQLIGCFVLVAVVGEAVVSILTHTSIGMGAHQILLQSPLFFMGIIMLTEPATLPPTIKQQMGYGGLVGILFLPQIHIGSLYSTPELALVAGNVVGYLVSPRLRQRLWLQRATPLTPTATDFAFKPERPLKFKPGQYLEWTLPHDGTDARGNRRYFTIASSPTEPNLHLGVKFYPKGSSFKRALETLKPSSSIIAAHLSGDFTLPSNTSRKIACIAGGIGITPYRSMIKYLLDTKEQRDLTLLYSVNHADELAYCGVFDQASAEIGTRVVYTLTDTTNLPPNWQGASGIIDAAFIQHQVPDFADRLFFISGPPQMVEGVSAALHELGVHRRNIKTDFFPGYI